MSSIIPEPRPIGYGGRTGKQSLYLPAYPRVPSPFPRSLVIPGALAPQFRPVRATPLPEFAQERRNAADAQQAPMAVREEPAREWRVDTVAVSPLAITWLDDTRFRFMPTRRTVVIKNHDPAVGVWISQVGQGVGSGGFLAAGESIALPLGPLCRVYALGINPATGFVSFYQLGS